MPEMTFNELEISAIGEVANISLGNAATALGMLIRDDIDISVPYVEIKNRGDFVKTNSEEAIITKVNYVKGVKGYSILFLKKEDVRIMTDLMMGSDGYGMFYEQEVSELHLSAVSEAMNQMMGSAATAMSTMLERVVDISTPETKQMSPEEYIDYEFPGEDKFVQIDFEVKLGKLIKTEMTQLYPYALAKAIADLFLLKRNGMIS